MESWFALYIKSNAEKKSAENLSAQGFTVYCPLVSQMRQWSDRKKKVQVPLFRSYLFIRLSENDPALQVLQTPGVVGFVNWLGQRAQIRDAEINAIRQFLTDYKQVEVESLTAIRNGDHMKVDCGALVGQIGTVVGQSRHKARLLIEQLGIQLYAEVPKAQLRPCS